MKHKHHIIPRHMGGTDDPSNIVELTIEEHAEAHRILWEKYGRQEDYLAYRGLSGEIGMEEILKERQKLNKKPNKTSYTKGQKPWNLGLPQPHSRNNAIKGGAKISASKIGKKRLYREDGSFIMVYPKAG